MSGVQNFYCWVKLSRLGGTEPPAPPAADSGVPQLVNFNGGIPPYKFNGCTPPFTLNGGIPPFTFGGIPSELLNGGIPPHILNGGIPPGAQLGGFFASGWWAVDEQYAGNPASGFELGFAPVAGSRQDAVNWLGDNAAWLDASVVTFFLMVFASANHGN